MFGSRAASLSRALRHLLGWRVVVLALSLLPLLAAFIWVGASWTRAIVLTVAAAIPVAVLAMATAVDMSRSADVLSRLLGPDRTVPSDLGALDRRLDILDLIVSSESRRPWEPTTLPLIHVGEPSVKPVLLLPGADYHMPEIVGIAEELDTRGIPNLIAVGTPHWERTGDGLIWYDRDIYEAPTPEDIPGRFSAVLTMKDWAGYAPLIEAAKSADIPTFAKVEGAQDFHDVDTNQPRNPYRTADHILCQGLNDFEALDGMDRTIVGSTRLERLWWAPPAKPSKPLAILNLNFTYGVMTEARDLWQQTAVEGCELAGIPYIISIHPAERARTPHPRATAVSASRLLRHATVLVSRFSTLPYESMARGVPFVYHNPHNEMVPAFRNSLGAFPITDSASTLATVINTLPATGEPYREGASTFFLRQVDVRANERSEIRSVNQLVESIT